MTDARPSFGEALRFWLKLGFISFGGPAGQIAIMHHELVDRKRWIAERRFLHALNFCMLLPGPEATQLAIYCGWLLHRTWGGIVAGMLFVLPAVGVLWALSAAYVLFGHVGWVAGVFYGLKPAVTAIVVAAVLRIGRRALNGALMWVFAAVAFVAIYFLHVPFPAIVGGAALIGWGWVRPAENAPSQVSSAGPSGASRDAGETGNGSGEPSAPRDSLGATLKRVVRITAGGAALWFTPVFAAGALLGWKSVLVREGLFFSKAAMVTFGGAYAVLPYVGQQAVEHFSWLTAPQMLDGLGLAETTPGPLIMVVQFVGFLGGWNQPGALPPLLMATLAALITTWTTFVPCFLWIFLGAPYIERLHRQRALNGALSAVTAAVVGVIANLAVWFGLQTFHPAGGVDLIAVGLALAAFLAMQWKNASVITVVLASSTIGVVLHAQLGYG